MVYIYILELFVCLISIGYAIGQSNRVYDSLGNVFAPKHNLYGIALVIFLIIIMSNAYFSDITIYDKWYNMIMTNEYGLLRFEKGYSYFSYFCYKYLTLDFKQFLTLYVAIAIALIMISYLKVAGNFSFFVLFFLMYELFFSGVQLRNFMAASLVVYGLVSMGKYGKRGMVIHILCVLGATMFHSSSIAYIVFLLAKLDFEKIIGRIKKNKLLLSSAVTVFVFSSIYLERSGNFIKMLDKMSSMLGDDIVRRIGTHSTGLGFTGPMYISLLFMLYLFFIIYINGKGFISNISYNKKWSLHNNKIIKEKVIVDNTYFYRFAQKVNMIAILFLPFVFLSTTYYRLIRMVCMFDLVFFGALFESCRNRNGRLKIVIVTLLLTFLWVIYDLIWPGRFFSHIFGYLGVV